LDEKDFELMGLPGRFHDANWAFMKTHGLDHFFEKYLRNLKLARQQGVGLFIGGNPSTGKSYAAAVVAKAFRQNYFTVQWMDANEGFQLLSWNKDYPDPEFGSWQNRAGFVDLLIIDNFGAEKATNRTKILLDTVKKRCDAKLPTVLTTRQNLSQLSKTYEDESMDFLRQSMKNITLTQKIESDIKKMIEDNF